MKSHGQNPRIISETVPLFLFLCSQSVRHIVRYYSKEPRKTLFHCKKSTKTVGGFSRNSYLCIVKRIINIKSYYYGSVRQHSESHLRHPRSARDAWLWPRYALLRASILLISCAILWCQVPVSWHLFLQIFCSNWQRKNGILSHHNLWWHPEWKDPRNPFRLHSQSWEHLCSQAYYEALLR